MTTFKNRKLYQTALMRRAVGKPLHVNARIEVAAVALVGGKWQVIATTRGVAMTRRGAGYAKDFARATAAIDPDCLVILAHADRRTAQLWCDRETGLLQEFWYGAPSAEYVAKVWRPVESVGITQTLTREVSA